jgi:hypothetical protein
MNPYAVLLPGVIPWGFLFTLGLQITSFVLILYLAARNLRSLFGRQVPKTTLTRDVATMKMLGVIAFMVGICWFTHALGFSFSRDVNLIPEAPITNATAEFLSEVLKCFQVVFAGSLVFCSSLILAVLFAYRVGARRRCRVTSRQATTGE